MTFKDLFAGASCKLGIWISIGSLVLNVVKVVHILNFVKEGNFFEFCKFRHAFLYFNFFALSPEKYDLIYILLVIESLLIVPLIYGMKEKIPMLMVPWIVVQALEVLSQLFIFIFSLLPHKENDMLMNERAKHEHGALQLILHSVFLIIYIMLDGYFFWFVFSLFKSIHDEQNVINSPKNQPSHRLQIDIERAFSETSENTVEYMGESSPIVDLVNRLEQVDSERETADGLYVRP